MSVGMTRRGRLDGDPQGSEKPRGKDRSERRGRFDPGWTPTETHIRNGLMRQFMRNPEGSPSSEAYRNSSVWCECGRGMNRRAADGSTVKCVKCAPRAKVVR
jgi:hypothetical protein